MNTLRTTVIRAKIVRTAIQFLAASVIFLSMLTPAAASCLDQRLRGVNLTGAEFNSSKLPGRLGFDYIYPTRAEMEYFRSAGMNVIRLPIRWERIQPQLNGALDANELAEVRRVVGWASELDLCIVLDLHNYGKYRGNTLGSAAVPAETFTNIWLRLYTALGDPAWTAFGLMNEPAAIPVADWSRIAQQTVLALRGAGATNLILVGSGRWSGAHEWNKTFQGTSAAKEFKGFSDPANNYAIELHQYADSNYSGTSAECIEPSKLKQILETISQWAKTEHRQFFLGEFGFASSQVCLEGLNAVLQAMHDDPAWRGWTYWASGRWWGNYPFSIHPKGNIDAPQMMVLKDYLRKPRAPENTTAR